MPGGNHPLPPGRSNLPSSRGPASRPGLLADRVPLCLCCRSLKAAKEPSLEPSPEEPSVACGLLASTGLNLPCEPAPGLGWSVALVIATRGDPHTARLPAFAFFPQHAPPGPAPPMAPSGHLLGAGLSVPSGASPHAGPWKAAGHGLPPPPAPALALSPPGRSWPVHGSRCAFCENLAPGLPGTLTESGPERTRGTERRVALMWSRILYVREDSSIPKSMGHPAGLS